MLAIAPNSNRPNYEPSKRRLTWPNGVQATMFSSEEPDRLRGPQHGAAWCDELCSWKNVRDVWDNLQFGLRLGKSPRQVITTTPKPIKLLKELVKRDGQDVVVTRGRTSDNAANLAPTFLSQIVARYEGTRLGRQELNAEILEDVQGSALGPATCSRKGGEISDRRMRRIVVAVDPTIWVSETADDTGLSVAGRGTEDLGYVLEDASGEVLRRSNGSGARSALYRKHGTSIGSSRRRTKAASWSKRPSALSTPTSVSKAVHALPRQNNASRADRCALRAISHPYGRRVPRIGRPALHPRPGCPARRTAWMQWFGRSLSSWWIGPWQYGLPRILRRGSGWRGCSQRSEREDDPRAGYRPASARRELLSGTRRVGPPRSHRRDDGGGRRPLYRGGWIRVTANSQM